MEKDAKEEEFMEEITKIMEQFSDEIKNNKTIFLVEPQDYAGAILKEMFKFKDHMEKITAEEYLGQTTDKPTTGQAQE
jgi:hypothetical protein